jgi:hypothetical protein
MSVPFVVPIADTNIKSTTIKDSIRKSKFYPNRFAYCGAKYWTNQE